MMAPHSLSPQSRSTTESNVHLASTSTAPSSTSTSTSPSKPAPTPPPTSTKQVPVAMAQTDLLVLHRAWRIGQILLDKVVGPCSITLLKSGWPTEEEQWNNFWLSPATDTAAAAAAITSSTANATTTLAQQLVLALEEMGPTYVKLGQALSSRPDIIAPTLAQALRRLQDQMQPFHDAKRILESELPDTEERKAILASLSELPVAAASVGQVYSALLPNQTKVAVKVQRPDIQNLVDQDAKLFLLIAAALETLQIQGQQRLIQADITGAIQEFMSRLYEELDYRIEARNLQEFASLYCHRMNPGASVQVVVPHLYPALSTKRVLVMEWIDGTKLVNLDTEKSKQESLALIREGIDCTLSQLLETGVLHADPHGGNLWKYKDPSTGTTTGIDNDSSKPRLAYVDFGLVAKVPVEVRDGLVCAVAELVFQRNATAVANLFGELALIPDSVLTNPDQMDSLATELKRVLDEVLVYPTNNVMHTSSTVPQLRFDRLINALTTMLPRFQFQLPPYFLNNVRALSTLEGMAREIQPDFNVLQYIYPYALERILANPSASPVVEATIQHLMTNDQGRLDPNKIKRLLRDIALFTGYSMTKILRDMLHTRNGQRIVKRVIKESIVIRGRLHRHGTRKRIARDVQTRLFRL